MQAGLLETIQHQYPALFLLYGTVSIAMEQGLSSPLMNERQFSLLLQGDHWFDFLFQPPLRDDDRILRRTLVRFLQRHPMADLFLKLHVDERLRARITASEADQALTIFRAAAIRGRYSGEFRWNLVTDHLVRRGLKPPAYIRLLTTPAVQQIVRAWRAFTQGRSLRR